MQEVRQRGHEARAERRGGGIFALVVTDRYDGGGVYGEDGSLYFPAERTGLPGREKRGEVVGDDERGPARKIHQRRGPSRRPPRRGVVPVAVEVEGVLDAQLLELIVELGDRLEQKGVETVARPGVVVPETVIDHQREPQASPIGSEKLFTGQSYQFA